MTYPNKKRMPMNCLADDGFYGIVSSILLIHAGLLNIVTKHLLTFIKMKDGKCEENFEKRISGW